MPHTDTGDRALWDFEFGVEVSARYHDWRRATLDGWATAARSVTLLGAVVALVFAFGGGDRPVVPAAAAVAAVFSLFDLTFQFGVRARKHTELYQRFKGVQEKVARLRNEWTERLPEWQGDVQAIGRDEPPTLWAVYTICWNQTIARREVDVGYLRRITLWQRLVGRIFPFKPHDFPLVSGHANG